MVRLLRLNLRPKILIFGSVCEQIMKIFETYGKAWRFQISHIGKHQLELKVWLQQPPTSPLPSQSSAKAETQPTSVNSNLSLANSL